MLQDLEDFIKIPERSVPFFSKWSLTPIVLDPPTCNCQFFWPTLKKNKVPKSTISKNNISEDASWTFSQMFWSILVYSKRDLTGLKNPEIMEILGFGLSHKQIETL